MFKNLIIVESPVKAKTIAAYVGKEYQVASCNGHIRDLPKKNKSINVEQGFLPTYEISEEKKYIVKELKQLADRAECVYLASDDDREGESISWHLKEALALHDAKVKRIVFREVTKQAILRALEHPRGLDLDLVNSQQARRILDRLVGYDLSPLLWKKVKPGLSAGRVQSVAVRLVVERERAIHAFQATAYFVVTACFDLGKDQHFLAELSERFPHEEDAIAFLKQCQGAQFIVQKLEEKTAKRSPAPPFTTSTLQQEASKKLGYSIARTMHIAQHLYETGKISYMRTDSVNLSQEAVAHAEQTICQAYGREYFQQRVYKTKSVTAQEAHEAIRPTDFEQKEVSQDQSEQRLYTLIWKRALASQMADAAIDKTVVTIGISTAPYTFLAQGEVVKFEGFLKIYAPAQAKTEGILPLLHVDQLLPLAYIKASERFTKPPARYTEASLIKQLEEQEIGRPSTYVPIISTIQKRGYIIKESREGKERSYRLLTLQQNNIQRETCQEVVGTEKQKLFPTDIAAVTNDFLVQRFADVTDYSFTAQVERQLDAIAQGGIVWNTMLREFYDHFYPKVVNILASTSLISTTRVLGTDPHSGQPVSVRLGKYGPLAQIGEDKTASDYKVAGLRPDQRLETITLEEAVKLFQLPREVGCFETLPMTVHRGRFGPYIKHNALFYSIPKEEDPLTITTEGAVAIIQKKRQAEAEKLIKTFAENPKIQILKGRWGPYIKGEGANVRIPTGVEPDSLTLAACVQLLEQKPSKKSK